MEAREEIDELARGVGRLRWEDRLEQVSELFPEASPIQRREVRHPMTGQPLVVGGGLQVPRLLSTASGVVVVGTVRFTDAGRLYEVTLTPDPTEVVIEACTEFDRWFEAMIDAVGELVHRFALGEVDHDEEEQSWTTDEGVEVALLLEDDRWEMRLLPHGEVCVADGA